MNNAENKKESQDADRISLSEELEVESWSKKFGISPEKLKRAVVEVGTKAKSIEQYLRKFSNS